MLLEVVFAADERPLSHARASRVRSGHAKGLGLLHGCIRTCDCTGPWFSPLLCPAAWHARRLCYAELHIQQSAALVMSRNGMPTLEAGDTGAGGTIGVRDEDARGRRAGGRDRQRGDRRQRVAHQVVRWHACAPACRVTAIG